MAKIHVGIMTQNELYYLSKNINRVLPYVDTITVVDGGSVDDTIIYMRNLSKQYPQVRFFIHPWENNFPAQRNNYLKHIAEVAQPGDWILCFDPDEMIEEHSLMKLKEATEYADANGRNLVGFRCRSVSLQGETRVWSNNDNFWKKFLIKWDPKFAYAATGTGTVHEHYTGIHQNAIDSNDSLPFGTLWYEHIKQQDVIWPRGARNCFIGGGGPNGMHPMIHEWKRLRAICSSLGLSTWHEFQVYMLRGNIDQRIKDWMILHMHADFGDGSSEFREFYKTYFRLYHPEEELEHLRGTHIP
jgi:glycosyltransferase involved in cell wall biosynthesis